MIWTGGAKKRLRDVVGKKVTNFVNPETRKEEAMKTTELEKTQPISDEELLPLFFFNFEQNRLRETGYKRDQKQQKVILNHQLEETFY
jgi:hypothetical protein